jgi:hypothetical protein
MADMISVGGILLNFTVRMYTRRTRKYSSVL